MMMMVVVVVVVMVMIARMLLRPSKWAIDDFGAARTVRAARESPAVLSDDSLAAPTLERWLCLPLMPDSRRR